RPRDGRLVICAIAGWNASHIKERFGPDLFDRLPGGAITAGVVSGRAFLEQRTIVVEDLIEAVKTDFPGNREAQELFGSSRSQVSAPLINRGEPIGVLAVSRPEVRPFTPPEIALLEAFADQAVIAIENAGLFTELERRNAELREALEQQTATAEVLRAIASSPTDLQPVLDAIVATAGRLTEATGAAVWHVDGDVLRFSASLEAQSPDRLKLARHQERPIDRSSGMGQAALER